MELRRPLTVQALFEGVEERRPDSELVASDGSEASVIWDDAGALEDRSMEASPVEEGCSENGGDEGDDDKIA